MYLRNTSWAHFRATMSEPYTRRSVLWEPLRVTEGDGGGGGGGGDTQPEPPAQSEAEKAAAAAATAAQDKKLAAEAASWRTKFRESESKITDLSKQLEELKSKPATPQSDKDNGEIAKLSRKVDELNTQLKTEREVLTKERAALRNEKINGVIASVVAEGRFLMPKVLGRLLRDHVDVDADGTAVFNITDENGEKTKVKATVENLLKHKPVDDFESFLPSSGAGGAGSRGGNNAAAGDGIDWAKVKAGDVEYMAKNNDKIRIALSQQG
jgi:hypothetical protein